MDKIYTIQEAARLTGLTEHALRYYERIGLLQSVPRATNGHRRYNEEDLGRIVFISRLRATDMPIQRILKYMRLAAEGEATCAERYQLLEEHRREIIRRIGDLEENLKVIEGKLEHYRNSGACRAGS